MYYTVMAGATSDPRLPSQRKSTKTRLAGTHSPGQDAEFARVASYLPKRHTGAVLNDFWRFCNARNRDMTVYNFLSPPYRIE